MLKSGDKVKRIHPLYPDSKIKQGGHYVVNEVSPDGVTIVGVDPTVWFLMEAFEKVED